MPVAYLNKGIRKDLTERSVWTKWKAKRRSPRLCSERSETKERIPPGAP